MQQDLLTAGRIRDLTGPCQTQQAPFDGNILLKRVEAQGFDRAIGHFEGVAQECTVAFCESRWPRVELEPWLFEQDHKTVAAALVMVQTFPFGLSKIAVTKGGPFLAIEGEANRDAIYRECMQQLIGEYCRRRMMLTVMARPDPHEPQRDYQSLVSLGFRTGSSLRYPTRYFVKIERTEEGQRSGLAQKWRYHLLKSEKEGLNFEIADPSELPRFQKLYDAMTDRKRFPDYSAYPTLPHMFANLPEELRPGLFFVTKDGKDVAGAVVFTAGHCAAYLYGATNDQALALRAGYFLQSGILSWLRENSRAEWYDLGGTDGFHGLHQFKKGLVGKNGRMLPVPPIANYASSRSAQFAGETAYFARDLYQSAVRMVQAWRRGSALPDQEPQP